MIQDRHRDQVTTQPQLAWIRHLLGTDSRLVQFLLEQRVRTCDVVIGELLLGTGLPRGFREDLAALPKIPSPSAAETRLFIERHRKTFAGAGVGWSDAQILHAAMKSGARIHTSDQRVGRTCRAIGGSLA